MEMASRIENELSTVTTFPPCRIKSGSAARNDTSARMKTTSSLGMRDFWMIFQSGESANARATGQAGRTRFETGRTRQVSVQTHFEAPVVATRTHQTHQNRQIFILVSLV